MTVAAIMMVRSEVDIIELTLRHTLAEGINHIYIADHDSTDGTRRVIDAVAADTEQITVLDNHDPYYQQERWMNDLGGKAVADGHEWVVPVDADEFWCSMDTRTVAEVLDSADADKIAARMWRHHSWNECEVEPKMLPKVALRWKSDTHLHVGSHDANVQTVQSDLLQIRELQYRGFDHFVRKARESSATIAPEARAVGSAWHHTRLDGKTDEEMRDEWNQIMARPVCANPIPTRMSHGFVLHGQAL